MQCPPSFRRWTVLAAAAALVSLALPLSALSAGASDPRVTVEGTLPLASGDTVIQKVITTSFDVSLAQRHASELAPFITSLSNTASPNYHHYLTPSTFARRFGASAATITNVRDYLRSFGLTDTSLSRGGITLRVTGTTSDIARALDTPVQTVRLTSGVLTAHLTTKATLPASVAKDVVAVAGLTTVLPESTNVEAAHASANDEGTNALTPGTCAGAGDGSGTTPNSVGGYTAQQQAALYGLTTQWAAGNTGVGQTIGIYELANYDTNDIDTYFACYGLVPNLTTTNVDGGPSGSDDSQGTPIEATLDVEEAAALAPGADLEVYQGTQAGSGPLDTYSQIASDDTASIISTSWGICEIDTDDSAQAEQPIFEEMATQGQTVVAAAGDSGSSDCAGVPGPSTAAVDDPASQPYVTGVGGLTVSNIAPLSETVWNDNCTASDCGSGGGGMSSYWTRPVWQVASGIDPATDTMRMVPDVSVMGDPTTGFIMYYTGTNSGPCQNCTSGWSGIGGTSIGAPLVSALVASAAQSCGGARLGFINPALYAMSTTGFHDVTTGDNDLYGIGVYAATAGYDMASGLGSPVGPSFFGGLCAATYSATNSTFKVSSATGAVNTSGPSVTATLRDANDKPIANAALTVSATATAGALTIDGDAASAVALGTATESLVSNAAGVLTFNVTSSVIQSVAITVTFEGQSIYTTTLSFAAATSANGTKPGAPTIIALTSRDGGFTLRLRAPTSDGGRAITGYQYSINAGASWHALAKGHTSINVVSLKKHSVYRVVARALNAIGASKSSAPKNVVTLS